MKEDVILRIDAEIGQATAAIDRLKRSFKTFGKDVETETANLKSRLNSILNKVAVGFAAAATAIGIGLGKSIEQASQFDQAMRNVNSIAKDSETTFARISDSVLRLGSVADLAEGPNSLAAALYDINSADFKSEDGLKILETSSKAATAGLTETSVAAKGIVVALNSYGKGASEAGRLADILFQTVEEGIITFPTLSSNIGKVTAVADAGGVSMEELGAAMAQLTAKGLSAEEAAIALRGAILKMLAPTEAQKKAAAEYGITLGEAALKQKGFAGLLAEINAKTGGSKEALFDVIGEVRAFNGALKLIGDDGGKTFIERIDRFENSSGALGRALAQQEKALSTQFKKLVAAVETTAIRVGDAFIPAAKTIVESLKGVFQAFNDLTATQQKLIAWSIAVSGAIAGVTAGLITLKGASDAAALALGKVRATTLSGVFAKVGGAIGSIGTVLSGLSATTVAAFAAVVGAIVTDFGGLRSMFVDIFGDLSDLISDTAKELDFILGPAFDAISVALAGLVYGVGLFAESWIGVSTALVRAGIPAAIRVIIDLIRLATETLWDFGKLLVAIAERDIEKIKAAWNEFGTDFRDNVYKLEEDSDRFFTTFSRTVQENLERSEKRFAGLRQYVTKEVETTSKEGEKFASILGGVTDSIVEKSKSMVSSLSSAWTRIKNEGVSAFDAIRTSFGALVDDLSNSKNFGQYFDLLKDAKKSSGPRSVTSVGDVPGFLFDTLTGGQREEGPGDAKEEKAAEKLELQRIKNKAIAENLSLEKIRDLEIAAIKAHSNDELKLLKIEEKYLNDKQRRDEKAAREQEKLLKEQAKRQGSVANFRPQAQSNDSSCGQCSVASVLNNLNGSSLTDQDINSKYGFRLLDALGEATTAYEDVGNISSATIEIMKQALEKGFPVVFAANGPEFSPSGRGHIMTATGFKGDALEYFDPATGGFNSTTFDNLRNAAQHPDGNFVFAPKDIENIASLSSETEALTDRLKSQNEALKEQKALRDELAFYQKTGFASPDSADKPFESFLDDIDIGAQFKAEEFESILGSIFDAPKAELVNLSKLFDEELQKELDRINLRKQAGVVANQEALQATRDRIAQELALKTLQGEEELAALQRFREAELAIRDAKLAQLQEDYQNGLILDEAYRQQRLAVMAETVSNLQSVGIVATDTQKMMRAVVTEEAKVMQELGNEVASTLESAFTNFAKDTIQGQADFSKAFRSLWGSIANSVVSALIKMIVKTKAYIAVMAVLKALMNSVFGFFGGIFGFGGGISSFTGAPEAVNQINSILSSIPSLHSGGIVGTTINPLPDELLTMLQSGESVLDARTTSDLMSGRSAIFQGQRGGGYYVENQNFYGANPYEFSQIMGRELEYELVGRSGF